MLAQLEERQLRIVQQYYLLVPLRWEASDDDLDVFLEFITSVMLKKLLAY